MPRPTTKENDLLPPYPRLGECYRLLANALDARATALPMRSIDS